MKFLHMLNVLIALAAVGLATLAGLFHHYTGHGLDPVLACAGALVVGLGGWWSAGKVGDLRCSTKT